MLIIPNAGIINMRNEDVVIDNKNQDQRNEEY